MPGAKGAAQRREELYVPRRTVPSRVGGPWSCDDLYELDLEGQVGHGEAEKEGRTLPMEAMA